MKTPSSNFILSILCFVVVVTVTNAEVINYSSVQPKSGLNLKATDDFSLGIKGAMNFNNQLDQTDNLVVPFVGKITTPFKETGYTGWHIAPWFNTELAKVDKINLSGGGELFILSRKLNKDSLPDAPDYFEIRPTGFLALNSSIGNIINVKFVNRFERRLIRSPKLSGLSVSYFRYGACLSIAPNPFTALNIVPSLIYEGYNQKDALHLSVAGGSIVLEPVKNVSLDLFYKILWEPSGKNKNDNRIGVNLEYTIDLTK